MRKKDKEKEICERANQIVKLMEGFGRKELYKPLQNVPHFKELEQIFLMGVWFGAFKALQTEYKK